MSDDVMDGKFRAKLLVSTVSARWWLDITINDDCHSAVRFFEVLSNNST